MPGGPSSPAIDPEVVGGEFSEGKEGLSPKYMRSHGAGGNLRNGSNAGSAYLNCRNRLIIHEFLELLFNGMKFFMTFPA